MIAFYLVLTSSLICAIRLILGPRAPDRVIAFDTMNSLLIVALVMWGIGQGMSMLLDIAIAYTLLSFIGT